MNTLFGCESTGLHGYCDKELKKEGMESWHTSWKSIDTAILSRFSSFSSMNIYSFIPWSWLISRVLKLLVVSVLPVFLLLFWESSSPRASFGHSGSQL